MSTPEHARAAAIIAEVEALWRELYDLAVDNFKSDGRMMEVALVMEDSRKVERGIGEVRKALGVRP